MYADINPALEHIKTKFDVGQEIDDIKIARDRVLFLHEDAKHDLRHLYETVKATMADNYEEMNVEKVMWCFYNAIDKLLIQKRYSTIEIMSERQKISYIFDTIGSMLERLCTEVNVQYQKRQIQHAIKTLLDKLKFKAGVVQLFRQSSETMRNQISTFDAKRKIQEICDTRIKKISVIPFSRC